jgi:hypothetical protein
MFIAASRSGLTKDVLVANLKDDCSFSKQGRVALKMFELLEMLLRLSQLFSLFLTLMSSKTNC